MEEAALNDLCGSLFTLGAVAEMQLTSAAVFVCPDKETFVKTAKELLLEFTAMGLGDPNAAAAMFSDDGAFEMPYIADFGFPGRYVGYKEIGGFFAFVRDLYPGFVFENVTILIDTPEQVFGEYEFTAVSTKTGRRIHQLFFGRLVADNGKIKLLREALNSIEVARAVYERGVPELPSKADEKAMAVNCFDHNGLDELLLNSECDLNRYQEAHTREH